MLKIGITGGIGSGKSTVAKIFALLGAPVYDADGASKRLYHTDLDLIAKMKEHFGDNIYTNDQLDRARLAAIVFKDPQKLELLNRLVHPPTIRDAHEWMSRQTAPYIVKEAAILFESGSAAGLDYILGVSAPRHLRIERAAQRDKVSADEVRVRMYRQIEEDMKMKLCDFLIINDETVPVIPQVLKLHDLFSQGKLPDGRQFSEAF